MGYPPRQNRTVLWIIGRILIHFLILFQLSIHFLYRLPDQGTYSNQKINNKTTIKRKVSRRNLSDKCLKSVMIYASCDVIINIKHVR